MQDYWHTTTVKSVSQFKTDLLVDLEIDQVFDSAKVFQIMFTDALDISMTAGALATRQIPLVEDFVTSWDCILSPTSAMD